MNTLRIFLAGASGTLGRRLVPQLVGRGHQVVGTTRSTARAAELQQLCAEPAVLDPLDARAVRDAVV
jgi:2-alkyl-3-oxoalkanoate reductase